MKHLTIITAILLALFTQSWTIDSDCKNSIYILDQANKAADPANEWSKSDIKIHIQEPRLGNPERHTKLYLSNSMDYFEMLRRTEEGIITRIVDEKGEGKILMDGKIEIPSELKQKYKLTLAKSIQSKNFYQILYGVPMSISDDFWKEIKPAQKGDYEGREVYRISMELKDELISKFWTLILSVEDYKILAIEFNHSEEEGSEGEIIKFYGEYEVNSMKIPRVRNWYTKNTQEYLGSDVIVGGN